MMSVGAHASGFISQITSTPLSAVPGLILTGYTEYLWSYKPNSWVAKIASIFRVLALLVVLPVVFLGVLDIVSYGIARTFGIIDDVKASTSDKEAAPPSTAEIPVIHINYESTSDSVESDHDSREGLTGALHTEASNLAVSQHKAFYASDSEGLGLAGADIFSPAASAPSSPTLRRRTLLKGDDIGHVDAKLQEGLRQRQVECVEDDQ